MADYFYTDPSIGRVVNNLSKLVNGDPQRDLQELQLRKARQEQASRGAIAQAYSEATNPLDLRTRAPQLFADAFNAGAVGDLTQGNLGLAATMGGADNSYLADLFVAGGKPIRPGDSFTTGRQDQLDATEHTQKMQEQKNALENAFSIAGLNNNADMAQLMAKLAVDPNAVEGRALGQVFNSPTGLAGVAPGIRDVVRTKNRATESQVTGSALQDYFDGNTQTTAARQAAQIAAGVTPKAVARTAADLPKLTISQMDDIRKEVRVRLGADPLDPLAETPEGLTPELESRIGSRVAELIQFGVLPSEAVDQAVKDTTEAGSVPGILGGVFGSTPTLVGKIPDPVAAVTPAPATPAQRTVLTPAVPAAQTAAGKVLQNGAIVGPGGVLIQNGETIRQNGKLFKNVNGQMIEQK